MWWIVGAVVVVAIAAAIIVALRRRSVIARPGSTAGPAGLGDRLRSALGRDGTDWGRMEEVLLGADLGVEATAALISRARTAVGRGVSGVDAVRTEMIAMFGDRDRSLSLTSSPSLIVVVGVNGSGKTTTIAKLAAMLRGDGYEPLLAAADTFRAAAVEQLRTWGDRIGVDVVGGAAGGDPAAVAFDAVTAARARGRDVVIVDTAGRLHSKSNLMDELAKVTRVLTREAGRVDEVLLVIDGTTGHNAIAQARAFTDAVGVTGVAITKLDGTARGGMALAVEHGLSIPVKLVGTGERIEDLLHFDPVAFVDRLMEGQ